MAAAEAEEKKQGAEAGPQGPQAPPESPEKKARRKFIVISVVVLLVLLGVFFYWRSTFTEDTDDAQVDGDLYQVSARVSGQVVKVLVQDNQEVKAGDVIAIIDPRDYQVALEQANAQLANARAGFVQASSNVPITSVDVRTQQTSTGSDVTTAEAQVAAAAKNVSAAEARVEQAAANAKKAQLDVERYTPLVQRDVISKQQYDQAVAQAAATTAALQEAQQNVIAQREQVRAAQQRVTQARAAAQQARQNGPQQVAVQQARAQAANADIQQQQAKVDQAKLNLGYTKIVAPIAGVVNKKNVAEGQNVSIGQNLLTIVPLDNLWVTANFKETQLQHMKPGQKVELKVDALGGRKYEGRVTQIGGATGSRLSLFPPENATGNYVKVVQRIPVRIDLEPNQNKDHLLRPGFSVTPDVAIK